MKNEMVHQVRLYKKLPKKYFKFLDVRRPVVYTDWLDKLFIKKIRNVQCKAVEDFDDDDDEEDIPLSKLQLNNRSKTNTKLFPKVYKGRRKSVEVIIRKRGRPKKASNELLSVENLQIKDELTAERDLVWWKNGVSKEQCTNTIKESPHDLFTSDIRTDEDSNDDEDDVNDNVEDCTQTENIADVVPNKGSDFDPKESKEAEDAKESEIQNDSFGRKRAVKREPNEEKTEFIVVLRDSKQVFQCMECNKEYSALSTLKYHMRIHSGSLLKCEHCDRGFTTNYQLKCHKRLHDGDLFMCHTCGKGFITAEMLKIHVRSHTGDRPFTCEACGKAFPSASSLTQHKLTHDQLKKYLCSECGSSFSQKRALNGHMVSHGIKTHICTVCGKLWARRSDLTEHMRVHTGLKPYTCQTCSQQFTQVSSLKRHQNIHAANKPIMCISCGKVFKNEEYFRRHSRKHVKDAGCSSLLDKDE